MFLLYYISNSSIILSIDSNGFHPNLFNLCACPLILFGIISIPTMYIIEIKLVIKRTKN